ncbi:hypothetical protein FS837_013044 [Tulasnella sp. UAMH 9824]|nr:hypothetical protein FS837_013044 [Tulasnella sp. UAMH 9824]
MAPTRSLQFTASLLFISALFCVFDPLRSPGSPLATTPPGGTSASESLQLQFPEAEQPKRSRRRHVATATAFSYHAEVYGALAWTFNRYFHSEKQAGQSSVRIYAEETEFVSLIKKLNSLPESIRHPTGIAGLIEDVQSTTLFPDDPGFGCSEDSRGWAYCWSDTERKYLPDASAPHPPFVLHLLGWSRQSLYIPQELERVVVKDVDFNMSDFYTLVQSMDIMIPGFSPDGDYLTRQGTSTVHTALENRISILATRAMLDAYPHIAGVPSIVRPASLSEMEAIGYFEARRSMPSTLLPISAI